MTDSRAGDPLFSIVVPVLNGASTIARCLDSVTSQALGTWELIVMDGASRDGTQEILRRYDDRITYWESQPDRGICHAWNKAIEHVRGTWVIFLGADDRLASDDVLSRAIGMLPASGEPGIAYGIVDLVDADGRVVGDLGRPWEEVRTEFSQRNVIPHQAVFHHQSLFDRNGRFDESFRICGDYEFLMRELMHRPPVWLAGLHVADVAATGISMRPESSYLATREMRRAQLRHGIVTAPAWRSFRLLRASMFEALRRTFGLALAQRAARMYHRATDRGSESSR